MDSKSLGNQRGLRALTLIESSGLRGLTIHEPYATLICEGDKKYETRSWAPPLSRIGEPLLIHAAKKWDKHVKDNINYVTEFLGIKEYDFKGRLGKVLGIAVLDEYEMILSQKYTKLEEELGNFGTGQYAWRLRPVFLFDTPIQCTGMQRFWKVPDDLREKLKNSTGRRI